MMGNGDFDLTHKKILECGKKIFKEKGAVQEVLFYYRLYSPYFPRSCSIFSFFDYFDE